MASYGKSLGHQVWIDIERRRGDDEGETEHSEQWHAGDSGGAWHFVSRGGGVTENTGGGAAVEVTTHALTTVDVDRVLGFEATTVSDWAIIQSGPGTLSVSTTASQGSRSLAVASHGYVPVQSVALTSLGSRVGSVIHYDIMLPSQLKQISPTNYGATQLYLNSTSLGLNNTYLGQVDLTPLPVGQWNTLTFTPTSSVLTKLRGTYTDLQVTIVVNAPYNATQPYLLDNLRFSDSTLALVTVVDGGGHPLSGLTVTAYNGSTVTSNTGVTDSTGLAKVWVPPGSYRFGVTEAGVTTYSSATNQCQVPGICVAATITAKCHGVVCTAKDQCHSVGVCDPSAGVCSNPNKADGTTCNDGNACTKSDVCTAGVCGGTAYTCNDGLACTADSCNGDGTCTFSVTAGNCLVGGACYAGGAGNPTNQCQQCTPTTSQTGWSAKTNGTACNDGNACTTNDTCAGGACVGGPAPNCNDGNVCTNDSCNPASGCVHTNNTASCNDGNACTTNDTCAGGSCVGGPAPNCNDGNVCTDDSCNPASGCVHTNNTAPCNDGNACTTNDTCAGGSCVGGPAPNCNDGNVCTDDSCNPASGCVHTNNTATCDDGNKCTQTNTCQAGVCAGANPVTCVASDACHVAGTCVPATGACTNPPAATVCPPLDQCHVGVCDPASGACGFKPAADGTACDDADACTSGDTCQSGVCGGTRDPLCAISIRFEEVVDLGNGARTAIFSYNNPGRSTVSAPYGSGNFISVDGQMVATPAKTIPQSFGPGDHRRRVRVPATGGSHDHLVDSRRARRDVSGPASRWGRPAPAPRPSPSPTLPATRSPWPSMPTAGTSRRPSS